MRELRTPFLLTLVLVVAMARVLPHPPNFVPVGALAVFGGAVLGRGVLAYVAPLAAMFLADLVIGLHGQLPLVYLCLLGATWLGRRLARGRSVAGVAAAVFSSSLLFFVVTNLGVWLFDGLYPLTFSGLLTCYVAAIPFWGNALLADALFAALLFGGLAMAERRVPALREVRVGS